MQQFDTFQKAGKVQVRRALKSFGAVSMGLQAVAVETTDYAKKSSSRGTAVFEKLAGAKTLDKALEIQTEFAKSYFEGAVAQATKLGELYTRDGQGRDQPIEGIVAKATPATK